MCIRDRNYPDREGKWDVAVLPACPDPAEGGGRATSSNGLGYATSPKNKNLDIVKDVLRFFGSEEGQRIQGESGAAIPAYEGLEQTWIDVFDQFDYRLNVECFVDMFDYSVQSVNNKYRSVRKDVYKRQSLNNMMYFPLPYTMRLSILRPTLIVIVSSSFPSNQQDHSGLTMVFTMLCQRV